MGPNWPSLAVEQQFISARVIGEPNGQAGLPKEPKGTGGNTGKSVRMRTGAGPASKRTSDLYLACIRCPRVHKGSVRKVKRIR